jgi:4-hydroxy-3-polyprenylbenzoate decarboxylase
VSRPATDVSESERLAAWSDLREFLRLARERGEIQDIVGADPDLEMGALYELSLRRKYPPVLEFSAIKGFSESCRVVTNVRNSPMLVGRLDMEAVRQLRRERNRRIDGIPPERVNTGPVMENVLSGDAVNVLRFPAPKWHPLDGGGYIGTECLVINKDPDSDWVNIGTYRVMVQDEKTLSVFFEPGKHGNLIRRKYWDKGLPCPMIVCVGQAPILGNVAGAASKYGDSEFHRAGGRIGRPIRIVQGHDTGLPFPADAELVFEGFMPPIETESRPEGPFAEWTGYYASDVRPEAVLRVTRIYHRNDPIILGQPPAKPTYPGRQIDLGGAAALWDALEAAGVPEVKGVWKMLGGGMRLINVVAIKQLHPGHAKMAGLVAAGSVGAFLGRIVIVVEDDIDITDTAEVMWALATRWDPKTQTDIIDGCWTGHLDPWLPREKRESGDMTNSRIIIYAVRPFHRLAEYPKVNQFSSEQLEDVARKWRNRLEFLQDEPGMA